MNERKQPILETEIAEGRLEGDPVSTEESWKKIHEREKITEQIISNSEQKKLFRNAYCFKIGYDFSILKPYCENIIMVTDGLVDHIDNTRRNIERGLADYDSNKDLIVLAGRVVDHLLVGQVVTQKVLKKPVAYQSYQIAMYVNSYYKFYEIYLDPNIQTREVDSKTFSS
jgi:hypothetical protein